MKIDWTTVLAAGITASVIGIFQFFTVRYLTRILDNIEEIFGVKKKDKK